MKRVMVWTSLAMIAAVATPVLRADVKTKEKSLVQFEGILGGMFKMFGGSAAKDGITSTVAVKGNRMSSISDLSGEIIDLTEQKVYRLDPKKKEYKVVTFAELKAEMDKAKAEMQSHQKEMKPEDKQQLEDAGKQLEFDIKVTETGQKKTIAGFDTHEVIVAITGHEKGKKIEDSGGIVLTTDEWLGPKIAALDEIREFRLRYAKAVYGQSFEADVQQMAGMLAAYPSFSKMSDQMQTESKKMSGTAVSSVTTFETVKSPEEMKQAQDQQQSQSAPASGLSGMLAKKMMGGNKPAQPKSKVMTATRDILSVDTAATADDVAIPAGYKEKK